MISLRTGTITEITEQTEAVTRARAEVGGREHPVVAYKTLAATLSPGDRVVLNTVAIDLGLGSGGEHIVLWNLSEEAFVEESHGHIIKLRYTPLQMNCLAVEEEASPFHKVMVEPTTLGGMPVVIGTVHSQLYPVVAAIKHLKPDAKIAYIMTDGAALPLALSRTVAALNERRRLDATITVGHAFGGDLEAVNVYSGLQAARSVVGADVAVVIMGPGVVGTGTAYGHTALEQGQIINAAVSLEGQPVAILRISGADERERHHGISHHCLTALTKVALGSALVAVPKLEGELETHVEDQIRRSRLGRLHDVETLDAGAVLPLVEQAPVRVTTMGRGVNEDPAFFLAAGAAGFLAAEALGGGHS